MAIVQTKAEAATMNFVYGELANSFFILAGNLVLSRSGIYVGICEACIGCVKVCETGVRYLLVALGAGLWMGH